MDKKALRSKIRRQKAAMTPAQIEACSRELTRKALASPLYEAAQSVYGYLPYNQEVRTLELLQAALDSGKGVAVPKVFGDTMRFIWLTSLQDAAPGYCGIPEPLADSPEADDPHALVLMPGPGLRPWRARPRRLRRRLLRQIPGAGAGASHIGPGATAFSSSPAWRLVPTIFPWTRSCGHRYRRNWYEIHLACVIFGRRVWPVLFCRPMHWQGAGAGSKAASCAAPSALSPALRSPVAGRSGFRLVWRHTCSASVCRRGRPASRYFPLRCLDLPQNRN